MTYTGIAVGFATFVVGLLLSMAVFAALDVSWTFLPGPAVGLALASYAAYRTWRDR